jgi:hypothetical protein
MLLYFGLMGWVQKMDWTIGYLVTAIFYCVYKEHCVVH